MTMIVRSAFGSYGAGRNQVGCCELPDVSFGPSASLYELEHQYPWEHICPTCSAVWLRTTTWLAAGMAVANVGWIILAAQPVVCATVLR